MSSSSLLRKSHIAPELGSKLVVLSFETADSA
jgi:hypothetical protein